MTVLVTGGTGLVGKYLQELLPNAIYIDSRYADLTSQRQASALIVQERPDWVIHLAAKVGGILDNRKHPLDYYEQNILMNTNLIRACRINEVKRFTGVLSTCAYPDHIHEIPELSIYDAYPLKEECLHLGPPSETNFGYGIAKRAMATHIDMCNKQHGTRYNYLIPCNLYGFWDDFHLERSHYVAALIRKLSEAKDGLELFGTGRPLRQFMYAGDFASVIKEMIDRDITESFNVATPEVKTIRGIAEIAMEATGKLLPITFDHSKPDGQYRKDVSIEKFKEHFPDFEFTSLLEGIKKTFDFYSNQLKVKN